MSKRTRHVSVSIDRLLEMDDQQLGEMFEGIGSEVRQELITRKSNGEVKIGSTSCEGFCPVKGCPGHEVKEVPNA